MKKFPSIGTFTHLVERLRHQARYMGVPVETLPAVKYTGTVKLHGTNASVRVNVDQTVQSQSRTEILHDMNPHYGFRDFVTLNEEPWKNIAKCFLDANGITVQTETVIIYGEWCGQGVQKGGGIALSKCPKHFVIFHVVHGEQVLLKPYVPNAIMIQVLNSMGIYWVTQVPTYEVTVDPSNFQAASDYLNALTTEVERECPWAKSVFDVSGTGEGIVWVPVGSQAVDDRVWFKTKGLKHKTRNSPTNNVAPVDVEKVNSIKEYVEIVLTENRMLQMVHDNQLPYIPASIGPFLKAVTQDIIKEESDVLKANGLEWKEVGKLVQSQARSWFMHEIQIATLGK